MPPFGSPARRARPAARGRAGWSGERRSRTRGRGRRRCRSRRLAGSSQEGRSQSARRPAPACGSPASGRPSRRGPRRDDLDQPSPAAASSRPRRAAHPRRRRSRTRRNRARAPPRPRWARAPSARRARARPAGAAPDREPDQPKARRTREKKLPRRRRGAQVARGPSVSPELARRSSLLLSEVAGDDHVDDEHAGRRAGRRSAPAARGRAARTGSRLGPGGSSISRSPSWLGILTVAPSIASTAEISTEWTRSWPRIGPAPRFEADAVAAEEGLEDVLDRAEAGAAGGKPLRAQPFVAVGVVGAAPLGVGEHLVGLRRLLELLLRLGVVVVDVRVELAGEPAEGGLHLVRGWRRARPRAPRSSRAASVRSAAVDGLAVAGELPGGARARRRSRSRSPSAAGRRLRPSRGCGGRGRSWRRRR